MSNYLHQKHNVPEENLIRDYKSRDTVGDAVFTRKDILPTYNLKNLAIVTFILFSVAIVIFNGHARSRLPIEGLLFLLTIYGYNYLIKLLPILMALDAFALLGF